MPVGEVDTLDKRTPERQELADADLVLDGAGYRRGDLRIALVDRGDRERVFTRRGNHVSRHQQAIETGGHRHLPYFDYLTANLLPHNSVVDRNGDPRVA